MMRQMVLMGMLFLGGVSTVFAAELRFPVRIGESEAEVRQRLGEPLAWYDDWYDLNNLSYKNAGLIIGLDPATGIVESVYAVGPYPAMYDSWKMYQGETVDGLGMHATLDQYTQALGAGRELQRGDWRLEESGAPDKAFYAWAVGDLELVVEARLTDYTENGVVYPRGSIVSARMTRPVS